MLAENCGVNRTIGATMETPFLGTSNEMTFPPGLSKLTITSNLTCPISATAPMETSHENPTEHIQQHSRMPCRCGQ